MKTLIKIAVVLIAVTSAMFSQAVGDYGSAASGNWGTAGTWVVCATNGTWDGATAATVVPNAAVNVWVRTGHTVTVEASPKTCLNLTIDSGAVLYSNQPTTTNRYLRVSGSTVTVNGTFGATGDGLGIEPYASVTFTGNGTFRPCRIRTGASISNITVTFDINTTFTYTGSSGTGGAGLYAYNSGTTDNITFTVNAGKTVSAVNFCNIATSSSTSVDALCSTVFNINGTLSLPGANSNFSLRTAAGKTCVLNVNGLLEVGNNFLPTSFTTANSTTTTINAGGEMRVGMGGGGVCDVDSAVVSGAGKFTLMPGSTINIGSATGLEADAGPIRTTVRSFSNGAKYAYVGTAGQLTGMDIPAAVAGLTVNNSAGVTLSKNIAVDTSLTFTNGKLITGGSVITVNGTINSAGAGKFVEGNLAVPAKSASLASWKVGQNSDYLPLTTAFNSVTGTDNVTVSALDKTVTAPNGAYSAGDKVLRRYYRVTKGSGITAFTTDSLVLSYSNADVAEQGITDENVLHVYKHDGSALSEATVVNRDTAANTVTITGVNAFSDFILSGATIASSGSVTFQVNMKVQSRIKKFDPAKDTVIVRGNFYQGVGNWWEANDLKLSDPDGDSIYVGTFPVGVVPKRLGQYKYVLRGPSIIGDMWEIDMGPNKDRTDTIPSSPWTLPVVWFNYDSTSNQIMTLPVLPLDFESATVDYAFTNFSGAATTRIPNPQSSGINTSAFVGKTIKGVGDPWAGSFLTLEKPIDFSVGMTFKVKVFMPKVGAKLLFKVENLNNGAINKEIDFVGTVANAWQEFTYDFSSLDTTKSYQKVVLIFDLGTSGDGSANFTYLFDDIRLVKADPALPLTFESNGVNFNFENFSGATTTRIANSQSSGINTSGFVAKTIKGAGDPWAGSYLTLGAPVDFSKGKIFKAKVFMPKVGAKMLLKFENLTNGAINKEIDAVGTKANEWEELTWDFSAIDATKEYQKVVVIFDLGTTGDGGANFTYLFDDIQQVGPPALVTFRVNMKVQAQLKKFNPAKDTVVMRGNFYQGSGNWWDANDQKLTDPDGDSIYVGSFSVGAAPKRLGQYKFVMRGPDVAGDRWEVDMGPNKDRTDTIPSLPWTLPVVWFNNDSTSKYSDNFITFQVNMKKQMKFGKYNKTTDSVVVRGDFNGWSGNTHLLTDPNTDSIYTGTFNITSVSKIIYKFVIHKASGDTWESSKDRIDSLLNGTPRTEPVVFFENDSILTSIRRDEHAVVTEYMLGQNYPNPFNPSTSIDFSILASGWVTLKVFNVVGQEVATVVNRQLEAGKHIATFNASQLTSGVYFYKLETGTFTSIKKMMLLK